MELLSLGVSARSCSKVVHTVLDNLSECQVEEKDLPARQCVDWFRRELGALARIHITSELTDRKGQASCAYIWMRAPCMVSNKIQSLLAGLIGG